MFKEKIASQLAARQPVLMSREGNRHGAVAMVLRSAADGIEALFIERTRNDADPWSGQMALPGGIVEPDDYGARGAAERETLEEVGIDLTETAYMGRLDDVQGRYRAHRSGIVVSGFVYFDEHGQEAVPNYEVADIVWEPLMTFTDDSRFVLVEYSTASGEQFPGVRVGHADHQIVWGLTRRFLASFFDIVGWPFLADPGQAQKIRSGGD